MGERRCKGCGYDLSGLSESRCPECGREFDPDFPATYLTSPISGLSQFKWGVAGLLMIGTPLLLALLSDQGMLPRILEPDNYLLILAPFSLCGGLALMMHVCRRSVHILSGKHVWVSDIGFARAACVLSGGVIIAALGSIVLSSF